MEDRPTTPRRIVAGSNGGGSLDNPPPPDELQVLSNGKYIQPEAHLDDFFDPAPDHETPIGPDDRTIIPDTKDPPWRKICQLSFMAPRHARGTGWLAGPRTIVTAGHNLLPRRRDTMVTNMLITPGRVSATVMPYPTIKATRFSVHDRWASDRDPEFDIGCIHLDEPIGDKIGWFSFANLDDETLKGATVNIAGYPVDGPGPGPGTRPENGMIPFFHANKIKEVRENRLFYTVDTSGGQSGAPVWLREGPQDPPIVVGIHCYGEGEEEAKKVGEVNSATRINPKIVALIQSWVQEDRVDIEDDVLDPDDAALVAGITATPPTPADAHEAAFVELHRFVTDNGGSTASLDAAESGTVANDMPTLAINALNTAVKNFDDLKGRLLRRCRVQQRLDLWASIATLILSSSLFAAAQSQTGTFAMVDEIPTVANDHTLTFVLGLLTVLSAIITLVAKRMGGGEGGLVAKYTELQSIAAEARLLSDTIRLKAKLGTADLDADVEKALSTTRKLSKEKDWMQASDFLFRDGGMMMRLLGDSI